MHVDKKKLDNLPSKPGVYIFRDSKSRPLYVGKALNLRNRVGSYFGTSSKLGPKTTKMIDATRKIEHIVVESEIEALLLEVDLIKRLKPKYNVQWKDGKAYKYIKISKNEEYPKVSTSRRIDNKSYYFGPFPEGATVKRVLKILRRIFPYRDCRQTKFRRYQKLNRACLYRDINLCPAPCIGRISVQNYNRIIRQLKLSLAGKGKKTIQYLEKEMEIYSKMRDFESAAAIRDRIRNLKYVTQTFRYPKDYLEQPNLVEDQRQKELQELAKIVQYRPLRRIEAYDISNIQGRYAAGSMVVFIEGEPSKKDYRRFRIKTVAEISDVAMIKEVLRRRFRRILKKTKDKSFREIPDLILIDGGKTQISAVNDVLADFDGMGVAVLGLAKKKEEVFDSELRLLKLPKNSPALHLLQRIRDEAHRFALAYHRQLRRSLGFTR